VESRGKKKIMKVEGGIIRKRKCFQEGSINKVNWGEDAQNMLYSHMKIS
jgi:hypothetical protein